MKKINLSRFTLHIFTTLPTHEKRITIPTIFTLMRMILAPCIIIAMVYSIWSVAFFFFLFACLTDLIDGFLARLLKEKTFLGAFLDPIADKILLVSCFFTLGFISTPLFSVPYWFVYYVMGKEILQCLGAIILYHTYGYIDVQPTFLGKITTATQMIFIIWLFSCYFFGWLPFKTYYILLSTLIMLISAAFIQYVYIGFSIIQTQKTR